MTRRLYHDNLYRFDTPQKSYWEATATDIPVDAEPLSRDEICDVAIIGGGYTGLSAATHLARDYQTDVRVLEAGHFGWGASGRNGGFCCVGGNGLELQPFVKMVGEDNAREYFQSQVDAVECVRALGEEEGLDLASTGDAEIIVAHSEKAFVRVRDEHELLNERLGLQSELLSAGEFRERYFDSSEQFGARLSRPAFGLHPLRYCRSLANAAIRRGAHLHPHSEVLDWQKDTDGFHRLRANGATLKAKRVIFATNGFMPERLIPGFYGRTLPVISAIIVTRPLSDVELAQHQWQTEQTAANSRRVMNYFRLLRDRRLLFGGRGDSKGTQDGEQETYIRLQKALAGIWPGWADVEIEYRWHGLICINGSFCPCIGQLDTDDSVYFGFGYQGNGVNTASWTGERLARWIGTGRSPPLPAIITGMTKKFALPSLRISMLRLGIAISSWADKRG